MSKKRFQLKAQKRFRHEKKFRKIYSWSFQSKSSTASDISSLYTIRHTCARAHTHRLPGCSRLAFPHCFQVACHAFPSVFRFLAWEMCIQSGRFELAYSFCMLTRTRVSKFLSDCWHAAHFRFLQIPAHNVVRFVTLELGFQSVRFEFVSCED